MATRRSPRPPSSCTHQRCSPPAARPGAAVSEVATGVAVLVTGSEALSLIVTADAVFDALKVNVCVLASAVQVNVWVNGAEPPTAPAVQVDPPVLATDGVPVGATL